MATNHARRGRHVPFKETRRAIGRSVERSAVVVAANLFAREQKKDRPLVGPTEDIIVEPDGRVRFVYSDALAAVFGGDQMTTTRASHVEPSPFGGWFADMSPIGGPSLYADGPCDGETCQTVTCFGKHAHVGFPTRQMALDAERAYIRKELGL